VIGVGYRELVRESANTLHGSARRRGRSLWLPATERASAALASGVDRDVDVERDLQRETRLGGVARRRFAADAESGDLIARYSGGGGAGDGCQTDRRRRTCAQRIGLSATARCGSPGMARRSRASVAGLSTRVDVIFSR